MIEQSEEILVKGLRRVQGDEINMQTTLFRDEINTP